jgi:NAD(P)-dependent dehydrogenase (short-subunit alcohol dehydrogenase family)
VKALVTGGVRGLGEAVAGRLVRDGWEVALLDCAPAVSDTAQRLAAPRDAAMVLGFAGDVRDAGRLAGEDTAFLASDRAAYVTGVALPVDGGATLL